jgi:hypothetical protein
MWIKTNWVKKPLSEDELNVLLEIRNKLNQNKASQKTINNLNFILNNRKLSKKQTKVIFEFLEKATRIVKEDTDRVYGITSRSFGEKRKIRGWIPTDVFPSYKREADYEPLKEVVATVKGTTEKIKYDSKQLKERAKENAIALKEQEKEKAKKIKDISKNGSDVTEATELPGSEEGKGKTNTTNYLIPIAVIVVLITIGYFLVGRKNAKK